MPCIVVVIALLFPRILIVVLWFFTDWFSGVFSSILWPFLGFLLLPVTTLWYSVVIHQYGGQWNITNIILMVLAIVIDMGSWGSGYKRRRR